MAVQREVQDQEQAVENANCLIDSQRESIELCDTCEVGKIDLQMFTEYTEGDKADMHAAGFAWFQH